jgi:hypothetical protein
MAFTLAPVIKQRFLDANGDPLSGGKLYTYAAGTTTPQATYTDSTGVTPNANPVVLDSNGYAAVWLNQALSYKFVLKDSLDNSIFTTDNVIGLLTTDSVTTDSIQDRAVTGEKIALATVDTENMADGAITPNKIAAVVPSVQVFTSAGSGTYRHCYAFRCSAASATVGATYTNNGKTFTVNQTIADEDILYAYGTGAPSTTGTLTFASGTGDATIAFTEASSPKYIVVTCIGGGAGGGAGAQTTDTTVSAANGGDTIFDTDNNLITAGGGKFGEAGGANVSFGGHGRNGGSYTIDASLKNLASSTGLKGESSSSMTISTVNARGGDGGSSACGQGGHGALFDSDTDEINAGAIGGGGGGGFGGTAGTHSGGGGGGGGGMARAIIRNPAASYPYTVGDKGTKGTNSTQGSGLNGGDGFRGAIFVEEHYV